MKLTDVVDRINGNVDRFTTELEYYIGGEHFESNELEVTQKGLLKENLGKLGFKFHFAFQDRDVVFMARNPHLRKAGMVRFAGLCSDASYILRSKDETVLSQEYLAVMLQSDHFWDYCESHKVGSVNFANNWSSIANYEFELPTPEEQKEISDKVWAAYRLKKSYKKLLAATEEMVKSQFIEMFGNNVSKKKISEVCDVRGGSTPTRTTKEFWNNGTIPWFTVEDIYEQGRYISETKQHITELATKKCFIYPVDTVLICCTASVGEYAITKKEMASNQQFNGMMIKDKSELHPEYLLYVASTLKEDLLRQAGKTTINFVSRSKLENIEIPVPPYSEQLGFVSIYQQADKSEFDGRKSQFIEMSHFRI